MICLGNNVVQQNMEEGAGSNVKSEPSSAVKEEPKDFDGDEVGDSHGQDDDFQAKIIMDYLLLNFYNYVDETNLTYSTLNLEIKHSFLCIFVLEISQETKRIKLSTLLQNYFSQK